MKHDPYSFKLRLEKCIIIISAEICYSTFALLQEEL